LTLSGDKRAQLICWTVLALCLGLCLALSSAYLALVFRVGSGRPIAPLDDSYIFFQYARQIAERAANAALAKRRRRKKQ